MTLVSASTHGATRKKPLTAALIAALAIQGELDNEIFKSAFEVTCDEYYAEAAATMTAIRHHSC